MERRRNGLAVTAVAVLGILAASRGLGQTMVGPRADCEEIRAIFDTYALAQNTNNADLYMSLWDQDCMKMSQDAPSMFGIKALDQRTRTRFQATRFVTVIKTEEIVASGDWGFARGVATQELTPTAGGPTVHADAKWLDIMKRQPDGHWKIYRDATSSNLPPVK